MGATTRIPRGFRLECEMFDPILSAIPAVFPSDGCVMRVLREPAIGNVIPDLLIGQWNADPTFVVPPLTNVARHITALLQRCGSTAPANFIEEALFLSPSALARAVAQLRRSGVIVSDSGHSELQMAPTFQRASKVKLIAVEMKMTRWREALNQSIRYLEFADEAYVVLDGAQVVITDEMRRSFELSASGLLLHIKGELQKVFEASPVPVAPSADRLLAIHKVVNTKPHCFA